ncbi:MAG TPA: class I SAM-dependent methyltransferase [Candidatus Angelobacter sp.]
MKLFFDALQPDKSDTMLDIGGWLGEDGEFSALYNFFPRMTSINLIPVDHAHADFVQGDACEMPFESKSYDYVFSNAVIEHVGDYDRQQLMAQEIMRVARKGFFVATPNLWFPVDPHSYIPMLQFMPFSIRRRVLPCCDYWMLSANRMQKLFPSAEIIITRDCTSIIAVCKI